jgi:GH24 family phage-related lysozyme (muramidase)
MASGVPRCGIELIKEFEGYHEELPDGRARAYPDPIAGWKVPTIGYGTTRYPDGSGVMKGDIITRDEAEEYLIREVEDKCKPALEKIPNWGVMNDNQRGALCSFAYNLGAHFHGGGNFKSITAVIDSPERWRDKVWVKSQFVKYRSPGTSAEKGLRRRREAEADLFCKLPA